MSNLKSYTALLGNSDNKLTQVEWSRFTHSVQHCVNRYAEDLWGVFYTAPNSVYQSCCVSFSMKDEFREELMSELSNLRKVFDQDSIAVIEGTTQFV